MPDGMVSDQTDRLSDAPAVMGRLDRWLGLAAVASAALAVGFALGLTIPLLSQAQEARGWSSTLIGLNAAMPALAIVLFGRAIPAVAAKLGSVRSMAAGIIAAAGIVLLFPVFDHWIAWFALRFIFGLGIAIAWVVSETWINRIATEAARGRMVAIYAVLWSAGVAGGPQLLGLTGSTGDLPFIVAACVLLLALVPVFLARRLAPALENEAGSLSRDKLPLILSLAPLAFVAAFVGGFAEIGAFALFPVWATAMSLGESTAVNILSVFSIGGLIMQFPIGWLADRIDRRKLLLGCGCLAVLGPTLLPVLVTQPAFMWPLLFLSGSAVMAFYTLGLTILGERAPPGELAAANVLFVAAYMVGGVAGPALGGIALDVWTPHGLPALLAAMFAGFLIVGSRLRR